MRSRQPPSLRRSKEPRATPLRSPNGLGTSTETRARTGTPSVIRARRASFDGIMTAKLFPILRTGPTISISSTYYVTVLRVYETRSILGRYSDSASTGGPRQRRAPRHEFEPSPERDDGESRQNGYHHEIPQRP